MGVLHMDRFRTLWDPATGTASDLIRSVNVICHELGHLWLAGLVSAVDDYDLLVTEGLTSYAEDKCSEVSPSPL